MKCEMCDQKKYKHLLIKQYSFWRLEIGCNQYYLGRCFIILNRHLEDLSDINEKEREELFSILRNLKLVEKKLFNPDKINYASLGNNDSHVHMHFIPRYKKIRKFADLTFQDENWGKNYSPYNKSFKISDIVLQEIKK